MSNAKSLGYRTNVLNNWVPDQSRGQVVCRMAAEPAMLAMAMVWGRAAVLQAQVEVTDGLENPSDAAIHALTQQEREENFQI